MRNYVITTCLALILSSPLFAQDVQYAEKMIAELASGRYMGRGYAHQHDSLAAGFIAGQLKQHGLQQPSGGWFQPFRINSNTFPGKMHARIGSDTLTPGVDYLVCSFSKGIYGTFPLRALDGTKEALPEDFGGFYLMDYQALTGDKNSGCRKVRHLYEIYPRKLTSPDAAGAGAVYQVGKLPPYVPSTQQADYSILLLKRNIPVNNVDSLSVQIDQEYLTNYTTRNVIGYLPGETDSTVYITAHYDHLGMMGTEAYFPGAHDNASGTAMVLDLARHYAREKPHYTLVFLLFSGEEIGMKGSLHYTSHPVFPLEQTKFVLNLDLLGSGEAGITVVNGKTHKRAYSLLDSLNETGGYLKSVKARGAAQNSDHWPFYRKGIPAFFIYTRGAYKAYHNVHDKAEALPLSGYKGLFRLTTAFIDRLESLQLQTPVSHE